MHTPGGTRWELRLPPGIGNERTTSHEQNHGKIVVGSDERGVVRDDLLNRRFPIASRRKFGPANEVEGLFEPIKMLCDLHRSMPHRAQPFSHGRALDQPEVVDRQPRIPKREQGTIQPGNRFGHGRLGYGK